MDLSYSKLVEALASKGATDKCVLCGESGWSPFGTPDEPDSIVLASRRENIEHQVVALACDNCGLVRLHSIGILGLSV